MNWKMLLERLKENLKTRNWRRSCFYFGRLLIFETHD